MNKTLVLSGTSALIVGLVLALGFTVIPNVSAQSVVELSEILPGDLVRGVSNNAVYYYGKDGFRYVFPNDKTFFTWYDNFDTVKWIADSDLSKLQIGGNVTYKPGSKMIKINSDPKTYAVGSGGTLRHVGTQEVATALYGSSWNTMIDDIPDGFFSNYQKGGAIEFASQFSASAESASAGNIGLDKQLKPFVTVDVSDTGFSDVTISPNTAVRFINTGSTKHAVSANDKSWGTGTMNSGQSFTRYFQSGDEVMFHDKYNESLTGSINMN